MKFFGIKLKYLLHVAVLIGLVIAGFRYLNGAEVWNALTRFSYGYLPFILGLSAVYMLLKAWRFYILLEPFSDAQVGTVMRAYAAGQAATLLPGGIAARAGILQQADVPLEESSVPVAFSSIYDQIVFISAALIAAIFYAPARQPAFIILGILIVTGLLMLVPAVRSAVHRAAEWLTDKVGAKEKYHGFLENAGAALTPKVISLSLGVTVVVLGLEVIMLDLTLRGLGASAGYDALALAYVLPTMLGRLSGLPAGVGITEAGMVGFLTNLAGITTGIATGATLIFRIGSAFFRALLGAGVYAFGWQGDSENAYGEAS
jgi:uncharacterized protein (TIRG00374 family)